MSANQTIVRGGGNPGGKAQFRKDKRVRAKGVYTTRVLEPRPSLDRVMAQAEPEITRRVQLALSKGLTWKETK